MPSECGVMSTSTAPTFCPAMIAGLHGRPQRDAQVRVDLPVGRLAEPLLQELADQRRPGAAADQHDLVDLRGGQAGVVQGRCTHSIVRSISGRIRSSYSARSTSVERCRGTPSFSAMNSSSSRANGWSESCFLASSTAREQPRQGDRLARRSTP